MRGDCATWLSEVELKLPSVVLSAKTTTGVDRVDLRVRMDGQDFQDTLDGKSRAVDPGPHTFRFTANDGTSVNRQVLVREGEQDISVAVVVPAARAVSSVETTGGSDSARSAAWIVGGAGALGILIGSVAGVMALTNKQAANCDATGRCDGPPLDTAKSAALVADASFVTGGALLGTAVILFLLPSHHETQGGITLAPSVSSTQAGISLEVSW
jgi:hypothetical protein